MFIKAVLSFALASAVLLSTPALVFSSIEEIEAVSGEIEQDSNLASGGWPTDAESIASYEQVLEAAATRAKVAEHEQKTLLATELNLDVGFIRQEGMNLTTGVKSTLVYPLGYCNKVPFEYRYFNLYGIFYFTWSWKNSTNKPYVKGFPTSKCSGNPILELQAPSLPYLGAPNATYQTTLKENKPQYGSFLWTYSLPLCGGPATGYQMWSIPEGTFTLKCTPFNGSADPRVQQVYQLVNDPNAIAFFKYAGGMSQLQLLHLVMCFTCVFA